MSVSPRAIKSKIKTVGNIGKITKTMEAVSANKARSAARAAERARRYSHELLVLARGLVKDRFVDHVFFNPQKGEKTLLVLVTSDKGLCGAFNTHVFRHIEGELKEDTPDVIVIGKKGEQFAKRKKWNIVGSFIDLPQKVTADDMRGVMMLIQESFKKGEYARVLVGYTHYTSSFSQTPSVFQLLPFDAESIGGFIDAEYPLDAKPDIRVAKYLFEPDGKAVLIELMPRLLEAAVYQSVLESRASEHSARMVAMKNATDNARELVDDLTLAHNTARQAAVTAEIAEIAAGAEALR